MKDVPTKLRKGEFVSGTVHHGKSIHAIMKDVTSMCRMEEFVSGMVRHGQERRVAMKDVITTMLGREGYVSNTAR